MKTRLTLWSVYESAVTLLWFVVKDNSTEGDLNDVKTLIVRFYT